MQPCQLRDITPSIRRRLVVPWTSPRRAPRCPAGRVRMDELPPPRLPRRRRPLRHGRGRGRAARRHERKPVSSLTDCSIPPHYGDDWSRITVETVSEPAQVGPVECPRRPCLPQEDCGAPPGYENLLRVLADPGTGPRAPELGRTWVDPRSSTWKVNKKLATIARRLGRGGGRLKDDEDVFWPQTRIGRLGATRARVIVPAGDRPHPSEKNVAAPLAWPTTSARAPDHARNAKQSSTAAGRGSARQARRSATPSARLARHGSAGRSHRKMNTRKNARRDAR
jgi:hypothetical protein